MRPALAVLALASLTLLAACGGATTTPTTSAPATQAGAAVVAATGTATPKPAPTEKPPTPTLTPKPVPTEKPPTATPTPKPTPTEKPPTTTPTPKSTPTAAPAAVPRQLTGSGTQAPTLELQQGLALFRLRNSGTSNYIVTLLDKDAKPVNLLANVIGNYDGTTAIRIPANGAYTFNVQSSGTWTVDVVQPGSSETAQNVPLPQTFSDRGARHTQFFSANSGSLRLTMRHAGSKNFIATLLNAQGQPIDLAANVIGPHEGSKVVRIPANGVYLFTVEADGEWSIEATQ